MRWYEVAAGPLSFKNKLPLVVRRHEIIDLFSQMLYTPRVDRPIEGFSVRNKPYTPSFSNLRVRRLPLTRECRLPPSHQLDITPTDLSPGFFPQHRQAVHELSSPF